MGFDIVWKDWQLEDVADDFGYQVARDLELKLEEKDSQVRWSRNLSELSRRVHNMFGMDGLQVVEISFSSMSAAYRTVCVVVPEEKVIFFYTVVPKKGSYQKRQLDIMRENAEEIREFIRKNTG